MSRRRSTWADLAGGRPEVTAAEWSPPEALGVFVPGLMGAGILLSGAILVSDGVRKLLPSRGVRRRLNVVRGVRRIVADMAEAAGIPIEERNLVRRRARSSWVYALTFAATAIPACFAARWGFNAYHSAGSALEGNAIAIFYGLAAAAALGAVAVAAAAALVPWARPTRPVAWLISTTMLGKLSAPPADVAERARLLLPNLDKGAPS